MSGSVAAASLELRKNLLRDVALTAPSMIVTIYGDIVVPRGGVLWMGTLIEICASFDISETQVRTAVSRLVTAGRLTGLRDGRRSYYELAEEAREEFETAAHLLYEPICEPSGWVLHRATDLPDDILRRQHFGSLGNGLYIRPDHRHLPLPTGLTFRADLIDGVGEMRDLVEELWLIERYAAEYQIWIDRFQPLLSALERGVEIADKDAAFARLLLVHLYRHVLLADPLLPRVLLPADWPGFPARRLFAALYLRLSHGADRYIGAAFRGREMALLERTSETAVRLDTLKRVV